MRRFIKFYFHTGYAKDGKGLTEKSHSKILELFGQSARLQHRTFGLSKEKIMSINRQHFLINTGLAEVETTLRQIRALA